MSRKLLLLAVISFLTGLFTQAQLLTPKRTFTRADTLRGSITPERAWWNLLKYDLRVTPDYDKKSLTGENAITFQATADGQIMQIDLQEPMTLLSATWGKRTHCLCPRRKRLSSALAEGHQSGQRGDRNLKFTGVPACCRQTTMGRRLDLDQRQGREALDVRRRRRTGRQCMVPL
jgi:hypothetical protein